MEASHVQPLGLPPPQRSPIPILSRAVRLLRPGGATPGRETFLLCFLAGASLLALAVGAVALAYSAAQAQAASVAIIGGFMALVAAGLVALRLGAPVERVAWGLVALVAVFLVAASLTTRELQPFTLAWLIIIPLTVRVLDAPRPEDLSTRRISRPVVVAVAATALAGCLVVVAHEVGFTLDEPVNAPSGAGMVLVFLLLFVSAVGLMFLHDLAARETASELYRLRALLSVCAWCRKIKDGDGWLTLEQYMSHRARAEVSHGICPACLARQQQGGP